METHYHFTAITAIWIIALVVAVFGTAHLLSLSFDSRWSRAYVALGF